MPAMTPDAIQKMIEDGLAGAEAQVTGDDGVHFEAVVVSPDFEGESTLKRHRRVYATLGDRMGTDIHALSLQTLTPEEWSRRSTT